MRDDQDKVHRKQQEVTKLKEQRAARAAGGGGHNKQSVIKSAGDKEGEAGILLYYTSVIIYSKYVV